ncbi:potassium transporter KefB [Elstera litoralis]|uniref:Potassium transporter KefB n=1 Tax=Elstera litoralis TaxID=552518 RepID=A0A0F3IX32_9PROT|nr:monovalent cation:proton antiporter-2 (CPA2) family protein [Elstera litoralis]KJV10149.1 potassium transporter KefB [Elstera litoralis]
MGELFTIVILLGAAVIAVPLAKRAGLGSVLGYLAAGIVIGPAALGLVTDVDAMLHVSEFGVVMLLFLIGLELKPSRLWVMRRTVFGIGGLQVIVTAALLAAIAHWALGFTPPIALICGFGLALSSTAFVLPMLAERDLLPTQTGRDGFALLLFQDLAIIPLVALLPLLAPDGTAAAAADPWRAVGEAAMALVLVFFGGRFLIRPIFRMVAASRTHEIFIATALLVVVGTAALVQAAGLSMSLGAFIAGVLLADSEYRHELQVDIEPFKGLLLGLFFIAIGMGLRLDLLAQSPFRLLVLILGLMALKAGVIYALLRATGRKDASARQTGLALAQGGEFGFVLFQQAMADKVMGAGEAAELSLIVTCSMMLTPLIFAAYERWIAPRLVEANPQREFDALPDDAPEVIICGFGRFGQIVGRLLSVRRIPFTALETNAKQVDFIRRFGSQVYYGDPTRMELLRVAGVEQARVVVIAFDDITSAIKLATEVRENFPHITLYARARNRRHVYLLMEAGLPPENILREALHSSLIMGERVLTTLGMTPLEAERTVRTFRDHDEAMIVSQFAVFQDEAQLIQSSKKRRA